MLHGTNFRAVGYSLETRATQSWTDLSCTVLTEDSAPKPKHRPYGTGCPPTTLCFKCCARSLAYSVMRRPFGLPKVLDCDWFLPPPSMLIDCPLPEPFVLFTS